MIDTSIASSQPNRLGGKSERKISRNQKNTCQPNHLVVMLKAYEQIT